MSQFSIPQQGTLVGDGERAPYDADEWSIDYTAKLLGFASRANYGVILGYDDGSHFSLEVTQKFPNNQIEVKIGSAVVRGTLYINDATLSLTVQPNISGQPRIDTVILRKDYVTQEIRAVILQGAPAGLPVAPTLTQSGTVWEIPLANIAVANGFSTITELQITPRQQFVNVGDGTYVDGVLNDSGVTLNDGDVVVWKSGVVKAVTTTTTLNDWKTAGVWRGITANGAYGRIQTKGFGKVRVRVQNLAGIGSASLTVGLPLVTSATAACSTIVDFRSGAFALLAGGFQSGMAMNPIGTLLQTTSIFGGATFNGLLFTYIDVQLQLAPAVTIIKGVGGGDAGTFTSGSWVTRGSLAITVFNGGFVTVTGANTFTLQPGVYRIRGYAAGYRCDGHLARFQDTTNAVTIVVGTPAYSPSAADSTQSFSEFDTVLIVETATNYQLQQRCTTTRATDGLGKYVGFAGESVTFAYLEITRRYEVQQ